MSYEDRQTMHDFIKKHGIKMRCKHAASNPHMDSGGHHMDHWKCTFTRGKSRMTITFSMGSGHGGKEPSTADVLNAVASDASGYENSGRNFQNWCSEFGYESYEPSETRKHKKTFNAVKKEYEKLEKFLGASLYEDLVNNTEWL